MEIKTIYWKKLIEFLEKGQNPSIINIDFKNEILEFKEVLLLNRHGFRVPENLVNYNDDDIDYSDDPELTEEELKQLKPVIHIPVPLQKEVKEWF